MYKCYLTILILFSTISISFGQQSFALKGKVYDAETNEPLAEAYIRFDGLHLGTLADNFGSYAFKGLTPGRYKIKVKYVGYKEFEKEIQVGKDAIATLNIAMQGNANQLKGVTVFSKVDAESDLSSRQAEKQPSTLKTSSAPKQ